MDVQTWLEVLSSIKGLFDVGKGAVDLQASIAKYRADPETIREATRVSHFSTYSDEELEALNRRINGCVKKFIEEGDGAGRVRCLCSVLNEAMIGNGGTLPEVDDWRNIYKQLRCTSSGAPT